ncbi:uncharacterized protein LOC144432769 [Glandiceps talaboti]
MAHCENMSLDDKSLSDCHFVDDEVKKRDKGIEEQSKTLPGVTNITKNKGVTFPVSDVEVCKTPIPPTSYMKSVTPRLKQKVESCFYGNSNIVSHGNLHALVASVHDAFHDHYPIVLSPDMIWLCIMQGLSIHINENAEKMRKYFVEHEGKKEIRVRRDDFVKGSATNPWPEVFSEFSDKIKDEIGDNTYSLITPDFTTTGPLEKAVTDIVLMEAMKSYFKYTMWSFCGIPSVTLEGTTEDWISIRERTAKLAHYDLGWWTTHLLPVLDQFINASKGEVDKSFWSSIYKMNDESDGTYITGWIVTLFPYISYETFGDKSFNPQAPFDRVRGPTYTVFAQNQWLSKWSEDLKPFRRGGLRTDIIPSGLSAAPYIWEYFDESFKMKFIGGFMGVSQDTESLALRPELGWAVVEDTIGV